MMLLRTLLVNYPKVVTVRYHIGAWQKLPVLSQGVGQPKATR